MNICNYQLRLPFHKVVVLILTVTCLYVVYNIIVQTPKVFYLIPRQPEVQVDILANFNNQSNLSVDSALQSQTLNASYQNNKTEQDKEVADFYLEHASHRRPTAPVTCSSLLEGDAEAQTSARKYMDNHHKTVIADSLFVNLTRNCTDFKIHRGYFTKPLSKEEEDFPIAYSILMYKELEQAERLLRAIYLPQNVYCIHVDAKSSDDLHKSVKALARCFDNVFIASKLEKVVYAGFSRLQADVNCMADVLKVEKRWKYYINLASQAFPIKTNLEMVKILKIYNGSNDIEGMWRRVIKGRFQIRYEEEILSSGQTRLKKTNIKNPAPPYNISIVRGSAYGIFSNGFVDFIVNDKRAQALLQWSRFTASPDEHYWSTLHHIQHNMFLKTPGGYLGDPDSKPWLAVYASWSRPDKDPCYSSKTSHGVCIFGITDLPQLVARKEFFANKFFLTFEYLAMDCLDEWLYNKSVHPQVFDTYYYRKLPFVWPVLKQPEKRKKSPEMIYMRGEDGNRIQQ